MMEISHILECSPNKVVYWMKKYSIERRSRSEAIYLKQNPNGDPFKIKDRMSPDDKVLYGLGIGIFWGEGTKVAPNSVRVANTDPNILKIFIKFLQQICGLKKGKIRYSIVSFNDTDPEIARSYWSKELKISPEKFGKITVIPKQGKGTYKKKSQFGVCTIHVGNTKLKSWIMKQMQSVLTLS